MKDKHLEAEADQHHEKTRERESTRNMIVR